MRPCQKLLKQEDTARSMQQSSAIPKNQDVGRGLRKIVACSQSSSQCLLVSIVFGTVSSLHPTSFLMIFTLVVYISVKVAMRLNMVIVGGSVIFKSMTVNYFTCEKIVIYKNMK